MNLVSRLLAYRAARRALDEPSAVRPLVGWFVVGFGLVVSALVQLGGLLRLLF